MSFDLIIATYVDVLILSHYAFIVFSTKNIGLKRVCYYVIIHTAVVTDVLRKTNAVFLCKQKFCPIWKSEQPLTRFKLVYCLKRNLKMMMQNFLPEPSISTFV